MQRTLDILENFEPKYWIIENPQTGLLKDQLLMWGIPFKDIDYCRYGLPYRKKLEFGIMCLDGNLNQYVKGIVIQ